MIDSPVWWVCVGRLHVDVREKQRLVSPCFLSLHETVHDIFHQVIIKIRLGHKNK